MKLRWGMVVLVAIAIILCAFILDNIDLKSSMFYKPAAVPSSFNDVHTLKPCNASDWSNSGPLVPTQSSEIAHSREIVTPITPSVPDSIWSQRAGFSMSTETDPLYWAGMLGSGWYLDWRAWAPAGQGSLEYWPMVRVHENCITPGLAEIRSIAEQTPGLIWIIGNEPDVIWQDNIQPTRYAFVYHALYNLIKTTDPGAQIAAGSVSQGTPLRLEYLDQVLAAYQSAYHTSMPVDWWTVHGYVLREEKGSWGVDIPPGVTAESGELREVSDHGRIDLFVSQIRAFRQWMRGRGYQDVPLALTEFGILMPASYGFTDEAVANYLEQTFTWLYNSSDEAIGYPQDQYHLVQKWAWFSLADPLYPTSDLADLDSGNLTFLGESFRGMLGAERP